MEWLQDNGMALLTVLGTVVAAATVITGFFDGPKADKARGILDFILSLLRSVGAGTFKNEPGTFSMPGKKDTGERIKDVEKIK